MNTCFSNMRNILTLFCACAIFFIVSYQYFQTRHNIDAHSATSNMVNKYNAISKDKDTKDLLNYSEKINEK